MPRRILLIGGHGLVGSRITRMLAAMPDVTLLVAGRDAGAVGLFVEYLVEEGIDAHPVVCGGAPGDIVAGVRASLMIDASGTPRPDHATARACIAAGVPYLDVCGDRATVLAIRALDGAARGAGVPVVSGAGVVPCLTMAAVAALAAGLEEVAGARILVRRGNQEEYGLASIADLLDHAGRKLRWWHQGAMTEAYAFQTAAPRQRFLPGMNRLLAYDTPDLDLLREVWPDLGDATVWAGIELPVLVWLLRVLAWLPRLRPGIRLSAHAGLFDSFARSFAHFGTALSTVRVELDGMTDGQVVVHSWTLVADNDSGAWLRAAPAVAMARQMLQGTVPAGARVARLDLSEILVELKGRPIRVTKTDMNRDR